MFSALVGFSLYSYTTSTYHRVKPSLNSITGMSLVAYVMLCGARERNCAQQAIGASITKMLQHIPRTRFRVFLAKNYTPVVFQTLLIWLPTNSGCSRPKVGYFSNNGNPTSVLNTISLKCCLPSADAIDRQEKIHACL